MSFLRTTKKTTVATELPLDLTDEQMIALFRNHATLISLSSFVQEVQPVEPTDSLQTFQQEADEILQAHISPNCHWNSFAVTRKVPYYGMINFLASLKDSETGYIGVLHAPQNLRMLLHSRLETDSAGKRMFIEDCTFQGNALTMPFVIWRFKKAHVDFHQRLFKEAKENTS